MWDVASQIEVLNTALPFDAVHAVSNGDELAAKSDTESIMSSFEHSDPHFIPVVCFVAWFERRLDGGKVTHHLLSLALLPPPCPLPPDINPFPHLHANSKPQTLSSNAYLAKQGALLWRTTSSRRSRLCIDDDVIRQDYPSLE